MASQDTGVVGQMFLAVLGIFLGSFAVGHLLAYALKLKDMAVKMSLVILAFAASLAPFVAQEVRGNSWRDALRYGIDLAGGTNLQYQVDVAAAEEAGKEVNAAAMDKMVGAIAKRLNPSGQEQITVRVVGGTRIEVIIPKADRETVEAKKDAMTRLGSLEFEILATERDPTGANRTHHHQKLIEKARETIDDPEVKRVEVKVRHHGEDVVVTGAWRPVADDAEIGGGGVLTREVPSEEDEEETVQEVLVVVQPERKKVSGKFLTRAFPTQDDMLRPAVGFSFGALGATRMHDLTSSHLPGRDMDYRLAIILDGVVTSAPSIRAPISSSGIIEGDFTREEVDQLVDVLNAGALEVPLVQTPISEFTQSPLLGADIQEKGLLAIQVAAVAVLVFMVGYYWFAGCVADVCLIFNLVLVVGAMALIKAAFTLPGLAGLVLTIGMAVDANVLIFERMREELNRGSSTRMAIQNGFGRAFTTIVDANVTTLIVAVVLFMIGTDQVKGFAVLLFVGIVMSMFSSLYFGRMIFDIAERKRWLKSLRMGSLVGTTRWDFLGKKMIAAACSIALIVAGLFVLGKRGRDNLDIDFNGGSMVTLLFENSPSDVETVRSHLGKHFEKGITVETLQIAGAGGGESKELYRLRTINEDLQDVRAKVAAAFEDSPYDLEMVSVDYDEIEPIETGSARFEGGRQVVMTFNTARLATVAASEFEEAFKAIDPEKYELISDQLAVGLTEEEMEQHEPGERLRSKTLVLKVTAGVPESDLEEAMHLVETRLSQEPNFEDINKFEASVAGEMQVSAVQAMLVSLLAIVAYIWVRFQRITFGLAAVAALVHDVLCVVGLVALAAYASGSTVGSMLGLVDFKINLPMIAAFLTIVGYSLNDTIVVFDRIREVRGKNPALTTEMVNTSLNQTLSRTLLTSVTTLIVVSILYAIGGEGIHGFAFALVMGVMVGTYSSVFVASPVLVWLMNRGGSATRAAAK